MKIEKYMPPFGSYPRYRPAEPEDRILFLHCTGKDTISLPEFGDMEKMLNFHNVMHVEVIDNTKEENNDEF